MPLPRKATTGAFEHVPVNVYDIITKQIVFNGSQKEAANFLGIRLGGVSSCLKNKSRIKNKYTIRIAKQ
jgi:plasmid maintenance system antidote protein VapI